MAPRSEDPKLIIRVTNLELIQPICSAYVNVTDRQTDRQTDGRLTIAIPRFALRASRGKKLCHQLNIDYNKACSGLRDFIDEKAHHFRKILWNSDPLLRQSR